MKVSQLALLGINLEVRFPSEAPKDFDTLYSELLELLRSDEFRTQFIDRYKKYTRLDFIFNPGNTMKQNKIS